MVKTKLLLKVLTGLLILFNANCISAQNVNIPDANFKNALLDHGIEITGAGISKIDTDGNGEISVSEAQAYTGTINVSNKSISDATGIEAFTAVTKLNFSNNNLTSLDVSVNTALTELYCSYNQLTGLNLSRNRALTRLYVNDNQLNSLNIANINNSNMFDVRTRNNSGLTCIKTDASIVGTNPIGWEKDSGVSYSTNCASASTCTDIVNIPDANFKNALLNHSPLIDTDGDDEICKSEAEAFTGFISVNSSSISDATGIEAFTAVTKLNFSSNNLTSLNVSANTALTELYCNYNQLTSLYVSANTELTKLYCTSNQLISLDISSNTKLTALSFSHNQLTNLDVNTNTALEILSFYGNKLISLDVSTNTALTQLDCRKNQLSTLDVSTNTALTQLYCHDNQLTSLNIANGNNTNITFMQAQNNSSLTCIQTDANIVGTSPNNWEKDATASYSANCGSTSTCTDIVNIPNTNFKNALLAHGATTTVNGVAPITGNNISVIDTDGDGEICVSEAQAYTGTIQVGSQSITSLTGIEAFTNLTALICNINFLTSLDISANTALTKLYCDNNQLSSLDISTNTALTKLYCNSNKLSSLDVSTNTVLTDLGCSYNQLSNLDISANTALTQLTCENNQLTSLNVANGNNTNMTVMQAQNNSSLTCIQTDAGIVGTNPNGWQKDTTASYSANCGSASTCTNIVNIPDANFKNALLNHSPAIDTDGDGEICESEAETFTDALNLVGKSISDFTGIEAFKALKKLDISGNIIATLDLSNNTNLEELNATEAYLSSINVTKNTNLVRLIIWGNSLSEIDLTQNIKLQTGSLANNRFTTIDVSKNTELLAFSIGKNQLTSIDVSKNIKLTALFLYNNKLTQLDISKNTALTRLRSENNELTSLNISNGNNTNLTELQAQNNPNLTCIQTDAVIVGTTPDGWEKDSQAIYNENCGTASIDEVSFNKNLKIYPNPVVSILEIDSKINTIELIEIYNTLGKKILKTTNKIINLSELAKGIYIIKIYSKEGKIATKKLIKE